MLKVEKRNLAIVFFGHFLACLLIITVFLLSLFSHNNASTAANCSGSGSSSLSLSLSSNTTVLKAIPRTLEGNLFTSDPTTVSVTTNHCAGYILSIKTASAGADATSLINTSDNSKKLTSLSSSITESVFSNPSNTQYNDKWGYKPSYYNSIINTTNYYPAPSTSGHIIINSDKYSGTSGSTPDNYTITLGARINVNTTPGSYANTFIITAVANPTSYSITYNTNAGTDTVTNMPSPNPDSGSTYNDHITLSSAIPERDDYIFSSWCTTNTSETTCSGTSYDPGDSYPINQLSGSGNSVTLYAVWEDNSTHTFDPETSGVTIDDSPEGVEIQNNILEEMYMAQSPEIYFGVENEIAAILGEPEYEVNELWSFIVPNLDQIGFRYGVDELQFTECLATPYTIGAPLAIVIVQVDEDGEITSTHVVEGVVDSMGCVSFTTTLYQNKNTGVYAVFNK